MTAAELVTHRQAMWLSPVLGTPQRCPAKFHLLQSNVTHLPLLISLESKMTISGRVYPSDLVTFYECLSRCQGVTELEELSKVVQHTVRDHLIAEINGLVRLTIVV